MSASSNTAAPAPDPPATDEVRDHEAEDNESEDPSAPPASAKVQWSNQVVDAIRATGNGVAITAFIPLIEALLGASGVITASMFTSRQVEVDGEVRIFRQTNGGDRVVAISCFTDQLMDAAPEDHAVPSLTAVCCSVCSIRCSSTCGAGEDAPGECRQPRP